MSFPSDTARSALRPGFTALVLLPFAVGYSMSYFYRAVNAVAAPDLVADLGLSASALGFLTATYLLAFAGFQLPLGILLDRFGPRRVQAGLLAVTGVGALVFATAEGMAGLSLGRALIGMGCAGGLMGGFKAVALWVPEERRALANACVMAAGGVGILVATVPAEMAIQAFGWRMLFLGMTVLSFGVALFIFAAVPEAGGRREAAPLRQQLSALGSIFRDPVFWRVAPLVALTAGVQIGVQTLWAGPWLRDVAGLARDQVASYLGLMALGFLLGTLLQGAVADWLGRRGIGLLSVMTWFLVAFIGCELLILAEWTQAAGPIWFVYGMIGQSAILAYPWLSAYFGLRLSGRSNTALNFICFSTAFLTQYAIGVIIDAWPKTELGGYAPEAYRYAFGLFVVLQVVALVWFVLKRPAPGVRSPLAEA